MSKQTVLEWAKFSFRLERGLIADGRFWYHAELDWNRRWPVTDIDQARIYEYDTRPGLRAIDQGWQVKAQDPRRQAMADFLAALEEQFELTGSRLGAQSYRAAADHFPASLLWSLRFELGSEAYKIEPISPLVLAVQPDSKSPFVCGWLYTASNGTLWPDIGPDRRAAAKLAERNQAEVELLFGQLQLDLDKLAESYADVVESLVDHAV